MDLEIGFCSSGIDSDSYANTSYYNRYRFYPDEKKKPEKSDVVRKSQPAKIRMIRFGKEKLLLIADRIRSAADCQFIIDEVTTIGGEPVQASARLEEEGGFVEATSNLINMLSEDELAFVVAHEVAHIEHRDSERTAGYFEKQSSLLKNRLNSLDRSIKGSGSGIVVRTAVFLGGALVGISGIFLGSRQLSQRHETEADERAVILMEKAGFNTKAAAEALKKIHGDYLPPQSFLGGLASTHPDPSIRVDRVDTLSRKIDANFPNEDAVLGIGPFLREELDRLRRE